MKKRLVAMLMAALMTIGCVTGCGSNAKETAGNSAGENSVVDEADQAAADEVAKLIDAIYVQERTDETDKQCADAKAAWDALTDAQKELVAGENADPDYFGRDTGDASKDDVRNQDEIGENEILVVSFGTSFNDSRVADVKGIEDALQAAYPDWSVRRAFSAQIIINHIQARDGACIDNVEQALDRAVANGVKNIVIQPTHLMRGAEYDEVTGALDSYCDKFETVKIAEPLLGEVGDDATVINEDKKAVAEIITGEAVKDAGYDSMEAAKEDKTAFVFMGHGTHHTAMVTYGQMQTQMNELGYDNVFIGTVEGDEAFSADAMIENVAAAGYTKVVLRPLMVVAGDHANNDMAGTEDDAWLAMFQASGKFESVDTQIKGLGQIEAVQKIYVEHAKSAMESENTLKSGEGNQPGAAVTELTDGTYNIEVESSSSMFKVEKAELTVAGEKMTAVITLSGTAYGKLYMGTAEAAQTADEADCIPFVEDANGAYTYTIPVAGLDQPIDCAAFSNRKKAWYDRQLTFLSASLANDSEKTTGNASNEAGSVEVTDGTYSVDVTLGGGSGKATVLSPATITAADGKMIARIEWSSPNYDYMLVDGEKYLPVNTEGNSVFEIPVTALDVEFDVIGDTVAMSKPREIEYTLTFHSNSIKAAK